MLLAGTVSAADLPDLVKTIRAVGPEGQGNTAAALAVAELAKGGPDKIVPLLSTLDGTNPRADNFLRGAIQTIAQRAGQSLPAKELEDFVKDTQRDPAARKLAFDLLAAHDKTAPDRLIPGMIDDPSPELRREAVQKLIDAAAKLIEQEKKDEAKPLFDRAMKSARDDDQVKALVKHIETYGEKINLRRHFGFLTTWSLIGPFDNTGKKGFNVEYPPEKQVKLSEELAGKDGKALKWTAYTAPEDSTSPDNCGIIDLKKALDDHKGAITYAYAEFDSSRDQSVELRLGTPNAWKLWLNGKLLFVREEYHRGERLDQYRLKAAMKRGKNPILIKVCQNEQTEEWAQRWEFRLRVCDPTGTAVLPVGETEKVTLRMR